MKKRYIKPWLLLPSLVLFAIGLNAQEVADTEDNTVAADEEVIELSPFEVTGDDDVGYQALSTLSGSRVKTSLRDIGSSITIINEELLRDTGAQNLEDVLIFAPNAEVAGIGGNYSAAQYAGAGNSIPEGNRDSHQGGFTRLRGLASADLTRDYFNTVTAFDTYNTTRVEVQRGANAALYGLGSPGGVVNSTMLKADFLKDYGSVTLKMDQYGTQRYSFKYNKILNDKVAILVAGLSENTEYEQEEAFQDDDRLYFSVTAKPFKNIKAHVSFETAKRWGAKPDYFPPNDGITPWLQTGKQVFDHPNNAAEFAYTDTRNGPSATSLADSLYPGMYNAHIYTWAPSGITDGFYALYSDPSNPDSTGGYHPGAAEQVDLFEKWRSKRNCISR